MLSAAAALALAVNVIPSAFAEGVITADEVRDLIANTGISSQEMLGMEVSELQNAVNVKKISDIIGYGFSFDVYAGADSLDREWFKENFGDYDYGDYKAYMDYTEEMNEGTAYTVVRPNTEYDDCYIDLRHKQNFLLSTDEYPNDFGLSRSYDKIAEIINGAGIPKPEEIRVISGFGLNIYIRTSDREYVILNSDTKDFWAEYAGAEENSLKGSTLVNAEDYLEYCFRERENSEAAQRIYTEKLEALGYSRYSGSVDARPKTDTRAPYIGTEPRFSDISADNAILSASVNELADMGVISGYSDGTFAPENKITRAEAAAMICRLMKYGERISDKFGDVDKNSWYAGAVGAIADRGIVSGYEDGSFRPEQKITYRDAFMITFALLGNVDMNYETVPSTAVTYGLTAGMSSFGTDDAISRADMAVLLSNALDTYINTLLYADVSTVSSSIYFANEMTLADYLAGYPLQGQYFTSKDELHKAEEEYTSKMYRDCGDVILEYYTKTYAHTDEQLEEFKEKLRSCGWIEK